MAQTLRDHPHLPLLDFDKAMAVFQHAGIGPRRLALLSGYSRQALYLWRKEQRRPLPHAVDRVNALAYKALALLRQRRLPAQGRPSMQQLTAEFDSVNLTEITPEILPRAWREALTQP